MRKIFICSFSIIMILFPIHADPTNINSEKLSLEEASEYYDTHPELVVDALQVINKSRAMVIAPDMGGSCYGSTSKFNLSACAYRNYDKLRKVYYDYVVYFSDSYVNDPMTYAYSATANWFVNQVRTGGPWDYKRLYNSYNEITTVNVDGIKYYMPAEDIGNIHYGYVGKAAFPDTVLQAAAGFYQVISGTGTLDISSYFDDPNDNAAIKKGIEWKNTGEFLY